MLKSKKNPEAQNASGDPQLVLQSITLKTLHFEVKQTIAELVEKHEKWAGKIDFKVMAADKSLGQDRYEASLKVDVECKQEDDVLYTLSVEQAGIFVLKNFSSEQVKMVLNGYCMNHLYPYICERAQSMTVQAGFPPAMLTPMNFEHVYQQYKQKVQDEQGETIIESTSGTA